MAFNASASEIRAVIPLVLPSPFPSALPLASWLPLAFQNTGRDRKSAGLCQGLNHDSEPPILFVNGGKNGQELLPAVTGKG